MDNKTEQQTTEQQTTEQPAQQPAKKTKSILENRSIRQVKSAIEKIIYIPVRFINHFLLLLEKHTVATLFLVVFAISAIFFHYTAIDVMLKNVIHQENLKDFIGYLAGGISVGLDALAVFLIFQYARFVFGLELLIILMLVGIGAYEFFNDMGIVDIASRTGLAVVLFLGAVIVSRVIARKQFFSKRQTLELIRRFDRKNYKQFEKTIEKIKSGEGKKGNYKHVCKVYKIKSSSLESYLTKQNLFSPEFFSQLPSRKTRKKAAK